MPKSSLSSVTLDIVLAGDTCDPISLGDFESYLEFKEHSVENLQFVVWFQDYRRRFFELPLEMQSLSPGPSEFSFSLPCPAKTAQRIVDSKKNYTWIVTSAGEYSPRNPLDLRSPVFSTYASYPDAPFPISQPNSPLLASVTPAPFIVPKPAKQPFRQECQAVVATFFKPGAPKELTLDSNVRDAIIRDLTWNTHPDVFLPAYEEAYDALSTFSLPHFLRLASENINLPKKLFWCTLGIVNLLLGLLIAVLLIVLIPGSNDSGQVGSQRAWRLFAVPLATLGGMQLFTAYKGFCSQVWGRGHTQVRPWELQGASEIPDEEDERVIGLPSSSSAKASPSPEFIPNSSKPLSSTVQTTAIAPFASPSEGESSSDSVPKQNSKQKPIKRIPVPQWNLSSLSLGGNKDSSSTPTTPSSTISYPPPPIPPPSRPPRSPARPSILLPPMPISTQGFSHLNTPSASTSLSNSTCVLSPTSPCKQQFEDASESPSEPSQPSSVEPKIPVFGPERVVLDPRIKKVHAKILRDMFLVGLVWGIIFTAVVCSVPGG